MTPNQSHLAGLELALQQWNNGGPAAHFAAQLRDLIDQAKAEPVDPAAGTEQVSSTWLAQLREEYLTFGSECQRLTAENARLRQHKTEYMEAAEETSRALSDRLTELEAKQADHSAHHLNMVGTDHVPGATKMVTAYISGHLDEIDAPAWPFINAEALKVGPAKGHIDNYRYELANGGVTVLWDGFHLHALAVTIRDTMNRTRCVRILATHSAGAQEWISVDERQPDEHKAEYLCLFEDGHQQVTEWLLDDTDGWVFWYGEPTHWMPLLAAPPVQVKP